MYGDELRAMTETISHSLWMELDQITLIENEIPVIFDRWDSLYILHALKETIEWKRNETKRERKKKNKAKRKKNRDSIISHPIAAKSHFVGVSIWWR